MVSLGIAVPLPFRLFGLRRARAAEELEEFRKALRIYPPITIFNLFQRSGAEAADDVGFVHGPGHITGFASGIGGHLRFGREFPGRLQAHDAVPGIGDAPAEPSPLKTACFVGPADRPRQFHEVVPGKRRHITGTQF